MGCTCFVSCAKFALVACTLKSVCVWGGYLSVQVFWPRMRHALDVCVLLCMFVPSYFCHFCVPDGLFHVPCFMFLFHVPS